MPIMYMGYFMKEKLTDLCKLSFLVLLVFIIAGACKITIEEKNTTRSQPTAQTVEDHIVVNYTPSSTGANYVNIYRRDVTGKIESEYKDAEVISIGMILPDGYRFSFIDYLIVQAHDYQYQCRICANGEYFYSKWSEVITAPDTAYSASDSLTYNTSGVTFAYDSKSYTCVVNGTISDPDISNFNLFSPVLIVSNGEQTQTFTLDSIANGTLISLRSILTNDFLDKDVEIKGIAAQRFEYKETNDTSTYTEQEILTLTKQFVVWTAASEVKMTIDSEEAEENIIHIPSAATDSGFDYSRQIR